MKVGENEMNFDLFLGTVLILSQLLSIYFSLCCAISLSC